MTAPLISLAGSVRPSSLSRLLPASRALALTVLAGLVLLVGAACAPAAGALASLGLASSAQGGAGKAVSETRNVSGFAEVSVRGAGTLVVSQTGAETLRVEADETVIAHIKSEVHGGRLLLGPADGVTLPSNARVRYVLTVNELRAVETAGAAAVEITDVRVPELRLGIEGAGSVRLTGRVDRQEVRISGAGSYDGTALESRDARVTTSGVARVVVNATESLIATVSGAGHVEYVGNPSLISHTVSGAGSVRRR